MPNIQFKLTELIKEIANTSIDISDGLLADLDKMINLQKFSYKLNLKNIPISSKLKKVLNLKKFPKINYISNGDDYQVLFTAPGSKSRIIHKTSKILGIKITKIGKIISKTIVGYNKIPGTPNPSIQPIVPSMLIILL